MSTDKAHELIDRDARGERVDFGAAAITLYLARHGQSEWNNRGLVTGQLNPGLSPKGHEQSIALAHCLNDVALAAIYSSALQRTIDTAMPTATAQHQSVVSLAALNEIHMGVLQGRYRDERDPEAQALWASWQSDIWSVCVPGGERFDAFARRVGDAFKTIVHDHANQHVLIVGHRATNRVLLGMLLGWPRERWVEIRPRNKYCYRVQLGNEPRIATFVLGGSKSGNCIDDFVM